MALACSRNLSSPSFREIELTTPLPCRQRKPASITLHFEESTMTGTLAMSGSTATRLRKRVMAATPSSIPSSMLMSMIWAPFSTCCLAIARASSYWPARTSLANLGEPVTLVRSPMLTKLTVGVSAEVDRSDPGKLLQPRLHLLRPQRAVAPHAEHGDVRHRIPKGLLRQPRQRPATGPLRERDGDHDRNMPATGKDRRARQEGQ